MNANAVPVAAPPEPTAEQTVRDFLAALESLDFDAALALTAPDIRWVNAPITSASNKAQFEKALRGMFKDLTYFEVQYRDIHERGNGVVYTDRIDIAKGGGLDMTLPVRGEFHVEHGLVTEWVDRFSWPRAIGAILRSLPRMIAFRIRR